MAKKELYFGGVPTAPDVKKLRAVFTDGSMKPGTKIPYESVAEAISADYGTSRFVAVTNAWRKALEKEKNIILGVDPGESFVVLSEPDKLGLSEAKMRSAIRGSRRSYVVAASIDTKYLSEEELARHNHIIARNANILAYAQIKKQAQLPTMEAES